jgi:WD40 repeat protein
VYGYDLRHTKSPSIISKHDFHVSSLDGGEEINNIDFFYMTKEKKTYLATADDDGMLRVADSIPNKKTQEKVESESSSQGPYRTYQHSDAGASALVTSLAFHPRSMKSIDIATAGTDCTICLWDISRPHNRPSSSLFIQQDNDDNAGKAGVSQVCNPPLVHALSWSPSGRLLSAGLGDGTCVIASVEGRKLVESCRLRDGHDSAVASVLFPRFNFSPHVTADDRLMISAGNDGSILLWDLGSTVAGSYAVDPATMFAGCEDDCKDISNAVKGLSLSQDPKILFGIPHNKKPNYMVSSTGEDTTLPNSLFIADTSHDITVYSLPRV